MNNNVAIKAVKLSKYYGELVAVDRVNFSVMRGEFFGFLGPNGAGKTTTVRMLTGVITGDEGSALILGHKVGSLKAKQVTGVVPEMANAYADLSGWNNLMLMSELYGIPTGVARERGASLMQEMGLYPRRDSLVKTYSKGMKQRLILCMALVSDPEVLFLDEPTSGLDVQSARSIKDMLQGLNAGGKTIFLTTHDMDEANQLCDRVAIINEGKIIAIDAPQKLRMAMRGMHSVHVSFDNVVNSEVLTSIPGVNAVEKMGDKWRLYTPNPGELVVSLVNYSRSHGLKVISLTTLEPSLEDAFVALTEKEAKDA
ncbi:MAG: ATP-binding cassette domain-containing protein [Dehalococcoidia bacterium]